MTKQITVRLPDDLVEFIDELVDSGRFESRAAVITRQVKRLQRRLIAEKDAEIYRTQGEDPELVAIVKHMSQHHPPLED
ncbi:MAG: ribbon-helix-helix domain-containing protein [Rhodoglobus sp.]